MSAQRSARQSRRTFTLKPKTKLKHFIMEVSSDPTRFLFGGCFRASAALSRLHAEKEKLGKGQEEFWEFIPLVVRSENMLLHSQISFQKSREIWKLFAMKVKSFYISLFQEKLIDKALLTFNTDIVRLRIISEMQEIHFCCVFQLHNYPVNTFRWALF